MVVTYFLEKQLALKRLVVTFDFPDGESPFLSVSEDSIKLVSPADLRTVQGEIKLGLTCKLDWIKAGRSSNGKGQVVINIPFLIDEDEFRELSDEFPTGEELDVNSVGALGCRRCKRRLIVTKNYPQRICALPSEYWQEIAELWFCCAKQEDECNLKEIHAKYQQLLVGTHQLLVCWADVDQKAVVVKPPPNKDKINTVLGTCPACQPIKQYELTATVECADCHSTLGHAKLPNPAEGQGRSFDKEDLLDIYFNKHMITSFPREDSNEHGSHCVFEKTYTLENALALRLLAATTADLTRRFVIRAVCSDNLDFNLVLTVVNTRYFYWWGKIETSIEVNDEDSGWKDDEVVRTNGAMKVLYKREPEFVLPKYYSKGARTLRYEYEEVVELLEVLARSTKLLPADSRKLNEFFVGFLRLN